MAAVPPPGDYFARARERINVDLLADAVIVVFGLGSVGSQMVTQLARTGVASRSGLFVLYDGKRLKSENVGRHELGAEYIGEYKVIGLKHHLMSLVPGITVRAVPQYVSPEMSDKTLLAQIADADLVIAATDQRDVQRRLGRLLVEADIPGVFPGVDPDRGRGEVFIYLGEHTPCFLCHDLHRAPDGPVRNVSALNVDMLPIVTAAASLCLGILDPDSSYANELNPRNRQSLPPTLFYVSRPTAFADGVFRLRGPGQTFEPSWPDRRPSCPGCAHLRQPPAPRQQPPDPRQPPGWPRQPAREQPAARAPVGAPSQTTDNASGSTRSPMAGVAALLVVFLLLVGGLMAAVLHHVGGPKQPDPALVRQIPTHVSFGCAHISDTECPRSGVILEAGVNPANYTTVEFRGFTKPLVDRLCKAKYRDEWRNAQGRVIDSNGSQLCDRSGTSLYNDWGPDGAVEWSDPEDNLTNRIQQLPYLLEDLEFPVMVGKFTATWLLRAPSGRIVLQARYQAEIKRGWT